MRSLVVAFVVLAAGVAEAQPAATVHGTVVDRATKQPVGGAIVAIGRELVATDDAGLFFVTLVPGRYTIAVTANFLTPSSTPIARPPSRRSAP